MTINPILIGTTAAAGLLAVPLLALAAQCLVAMLPERRQRESSMPAARPACDVLVPAHNEEGVIAATLASLQGDMGEHDRLWVIADNCSDRTADVARRRGARVVERTDALHRGKGFALDRGLQALRAIGPRPVVIVVDADCTVDSGAIARLASTAAETRRPVQACYLMHAPQSGASHRPAVGCLISQFAVTIRNLVRPLGMWRCGGPCLLTGSGMAFRADLLPRLRLSHGHIVEDMQLGIELAASGLPPLFCPRAVVRAPLPVDRAAARTQRTRWEHGHLKILLAWVPRLLWTGCRLRRISLIALAFDLAVPPLTLLLLASLSVCGISLLLGLVAGQWLPLAIVGTAGLPAAAGLGLAWRRYERATMPAGIWFHLPAYLWSKLPIYARFVRGPQTEWVRTARPAIAAGTDATDAGSRRPD